MPESRRRKPKKPKPPVPGLKVKIKRGVKYLRMTDETGRHVWVPVPKSDKD